MLSHIGDTEKKTLFENIQKPILTINYLGEHRENQELNDFYPKKRLFDFFPLEEGHQILAPPKKPCKNTIDRF